MTAELTPTTDPGHHRERMVSALVDLGIARSPRVLHALRAVPRHLLPGVDPAQVHEPFQVALRKRGEDGVTLSTVSAPHVQAIQLEQARIRPGDRVLEIGSGGINAAYLAELVGPGGEVVTVDIDDEIAARARGFLADAGYPQVEVVTGDAGLPGTVAGVFDRIVVTVETTDVPGTWWDQLADDGILVAPLRWRGQRRTVALSRRGTDLLIAQDLRQAGFVPMQGTGECRETLAVLHDVPGERVVLRLDGGPAVAAGDLGTALRSGRTTRWTGVEVHPTQAYASLDLWLATVLDEVATMTGDSGAHRAGLVPAPSPIGWPVLVAGASFAYRTLRRAADGGPERWEIGVVGHGERRATVADRYAEAVRAWPRHGAGPRLTVSRRHPAPEPADGPSRTVHRPGCTLTISWPSSVPDHGQVAGDTRPT